MRTAISGAWIYGIVIVFMVVLIAYVSITINYYKAFEMSQEMITALEQSEGFNSRSVTKINDIFKGYGYSSRGVCKKREGNPFIGVVGGVPERTKDKPGRYNYCIYRTKVVNGAQTKYYYETTTFFSFSLPVLGDIFTFRVPANTDAIIYLTDSYFRD